LKLYLKKAPVKEFLKELKLDNQWEDAMETGRV